MRRMTVAEARAAGLLDGPVKKVRTRTKDYSEDRGPYHTRCRCGAEFHTIKAEDEHVAPGHNAFEVVL